MSGYQFEEWEILRLARTLGGPLKVKGLLQVMKDKNITIDSLMAYLKSIEYKVPSPLEKKIEELERRLSALDGKAPQVMPVTPVTPEEPLKPPAEEWSYDDLRKDLDSLEKWHHLTFLYYKVLTEAQSKVSREDLVTKISQLSGKKLTGYGLAGIQAGITRSMTKHNYERWDWKDNDSQFFSINEKYREKMKEYFRSKGEGTK